MLGLIPLALTAAVLVGYGVGLYRLQRRGVHWPVGRTAGAVSGAGCIAVALLPPMADHDEMFPVHVGQHLMLGMAGPALLALSAPVTLALRTLEVRPRRVLLQLVHSRVVRVVTAPWVAVVLDVGGLYLLYLSGIYARAEDNPLVHAAVHVHMFVAGCLLSWAIVGVDPVRRRPGFAVRIAVLVVAGAAHDTLAKVLYAHDLPAGGGPVGRRQMGAELMYYGGTVVDLALAVALMAQWWRVGGRALARTNRPARRGSPVRERLPSGESPPIRAG